MDCGLEVSEFELQLRYYVHSLINIIISPDMGYIVSLPFFYMDVFDIK